MAALHGFTQVSFKGDCLSLINKVVSPKEGLTSLGHMVVLLQSLLFSFDEFSVSFIPKRFNQSAHCLARHGFSITGFTDWFPSVPMDVYSAFSADIPS